MSRVLSARWLLNRSTYTGGPVGMARSTQLVVLIKNIVLFMVLDVPICVANIHFHKL